MAILDDIITKENRPGLRGSPLEADSVRIIFQRNADFFRVSRGCTDYKVKARINASKATTFTELRSAVEQCQSAHQRYMDKLRARHA